jgi:hypothetical protein
VAQIAAIGAFDGLDELEANKRVYAENRALLLGELPKAGLERIVPADGAFYLYADVGDFTSDSVAFTKEMLNETGVAATPGVDFDAEQGGRYVPSATPARRRYGGSRAPAGGGAAQDARVRRLTAAGRATCRPARVRGSKLTVFQVHRCRLADLGGVVPLARRFFCGFRRKTQASKTPMPTPPAVMHWAAAAVPAEASTRTRPNPRSKPCERASSSVLRVRNGGIVDPVNDRASCLPETSAISTITFLWAASTVQPLWKVSTIMSPSMRLAGAGATVDPHRCRITR